MTGGRAGRVAAWVGVAAAIGLAAVTLEARDRWYPRAPSEERLLYLTNGRVADRLSLSFDAVMADVYWIRTIQHYGRERKTPRFSGQFELLHPLIDLTTSLDPYFTVAYQFGAFFLAEPQPNGPGRVDLAIALLEKGLRAEPPRWQYAQYLGFMHYWYTGDMTAAAREFTRASEIPGAPIWLKPVAANMLIKGGDREAARALLTELSRADERWIRDLALRKLRELDEGGRR
ncbi:MAG: hypothetical protein NUW22_00950 [Acidobacteria bacterium]|nr:hypothetical protein [Acidobacteriota bacterium]